ncbi:hypothetical protein RMCBS344292_10621 [Rhizopus microsporus]|nr:hypothetical protein RMCBS344292_10621 [Rhizopus microsporus]
MGFNVQIRLDLPQELYDHIISYLDRCDMYQFCLVSKAWYSFWSPYLYRNVALTGFNKRYDLETYFPRHLGQYVKEIEISCGGIITSGTYRNLKILTNYCPNVESLVCYGSDLPIEWWLIFQHVLREGHMWRRVREIPEPTILTRDMELYYQSADLVRDSLQSIYLAGPDDRCVMAQDVKRFATYKNLQQVTVLAQKGFTMIEDFELLFRYTDHLTHMTIDWTKSVPCEEWAQACTINDKEPSQNIQPCPSVKQLILHLHPDCCLDCYFPLLDYFCAKFIGLRVIFIANFIESIYFSSLKTKAEIVTECDSIKDRGI